MAVTVANIISGTLLHKGSVIATADGDTTATIPHGLPAIPDEVVIERLTGAAILSDWLITTVDATNVVLTKTTAAGSGAAPIQINVVSKVIHSIQR